MRESIPTQQRYHFPEKRREFLRAFLGGLTVLWAGGMLCALKNYFFFRPPSAGLTIGAFSKYKPGQMVHDEKMRFFIMRDSRGLFVMSDACTHRSCMLRLDADQLFCPCHNARFDLYGNPVKGPAEKQLDYYYIYKNREKVLVVDPGRTVYCSFRYIE